MSDFGEGESLEGESLGDVPCFVLMQEQGTAGTISAVSEVSLGFTISDYHPFTVEHSSGANSTGQHFSEWEGGLCSLN